MPWLPGICYLQWIYFPQLAWGEGAGVRLNDIRETSQHFKNIGQRRKQHISTKHCLLINVIVIWFLSIFKHLEILFDKENMN